MDRYKETFDTWNNVALLYQEKFMALTLYNKTYDFFCSLIDKPDAKILDIGCGPGNITKYLHSQRPDLDISGIDIAPNMVELAKKNNPAARFTVMDCRKINNLVTEFDGIVSGFCLPYLSPTERKEFILNANRLLNNHGLLYLSFVEGKPHQSAFKTNSCGRVFFNYIELSDLKSQLKAFKFEVLKKYTLPYKVSETAIEQHTILIARKKNAL